MYVEIGNKLYTIIDASTIPNVYNYERKLADEWYPYATISPLNWVNTVETTTQDRLVVGYTIAIYVRNKSLATAEWEIRAYVDEIMQDLRADEYLTGTALRGEFELERGRLNDEQPVRVCNIKCNYLLLVTI